MNTSNPIQEPCGALTRARTRCRRRPCKGRRRCHLHGGKSLRGVDHLRFKHGRYSKDDPLGERAKERAAKRVRAIGRDVEREMAKIPHPFTTGRSRVVGRVATGRYLNKYLAACRRAEAKHPRVPPGPGALSVAHAQMWLEINRRRRAAKAEGSEEPKES